MIASLPMYDFPELREATDGFWRAMAAVLKVDIDLVRHPENWTDAWHSPDLLLSQTCGYPFTHDFKGQLKLVATPHYAAAGCEGPKYCSIVFARETMPLHALEGQRAAFNNRDSMSGMLALKLVFQPLALSGRFFSEAIETGGHLASLEAVRLGRADVCATDAVTVAYMRRNRPGALEGLVEIARSPLVPGLPLVTRGGNITALRSALAEVFADNSLAATRDALLLTSYSLLDEADYQQIITLEAEMQAKGDLKLF